MRFSELSTQQGNIVAKFSLATTQEVAAGSQWYKNAQVLASRMASMYEIPVQTVAAVIAALSPNNKWERNCLDAENIMTAYHHGCADDALAVKVCTYKANKIKAVKCLEKGMDYDDLKTVLNGPKVIEFFHCIIGTPHRDVCIDGHAYSIWFGERLTMKEVPNIGKKLRERIKEDYVTVTDWINEELSDDRHLVNYEPSQIQAITWVCHKRIYGV